MAIAKIPAFVINLFLFVIFLILERTIWRHRYIGYYDWPNRPMAEYITEAKRLAQLHKENCQ